MQILMPIFAEADATSPFQTMILVYFHEKMYVFFYLKAWTFIKFRLKTIKRAELETYEIKFALLSLAR